MSDPIYVWLICGFWLVLIWPHSVVLVPPGFDQNLCLLERVENLSIKEFIAQTGVEAFNVAVLLGTAWGDIGRLGASGRNPACTALATNSGPLSDLI